MIEYFFSIGSHGSAMKYWGSTSAKGRGVTDLTSDNLSEIVGSQNKVIVQYGATWCGNCRMVKPKVKKLAEKNEEISFVYVDAEKFPESRKLADVSNLPTFAAFEGGSLKQQNQGNKIDLVEELVHALTGN